MEKKEQILYRLEYENRYEQVTDDNNENKTLNKDRNMVLISHVLPKGFAVDGHFHDWYEVTYVVYGEQKITVNENAYLLSQGDIIMIRPNQMHSSLTMDECKKATLMFDRTLIERLIPEGMDNVVCNSTLIHTVEEYRKYMKLIEVFFELCRGFGQEDTEGKLYTGMNLFSFLHQLMTGFRTEDNSMEVTRNRHDLFVEEITSYLYKNYSQNLTLNDVSAQFHCKPQYVSKLLKQVKNRTFLDLLNEIRLNHAVYDLMHSDKTMTDIALDCGYGSYKSFVHAFEEKYGETPKQYRKKAS